ncbi:MAG: glycosyltransferase [Candidatus Nanoarchaeia archaeon]
MDVASIIPFYYLSDNFNKDVKLLQTTINALRNYSKVVVVVDDGTELKKVKNAVVLKHDHNMGKGEAIRTGLRYVFEKEKSIGLIIECDADNDQDPEEAWLFRNYRFCDAGENDFLYLGDRYYAPQMNPPGRYRSKINVLQTLLFSELGIKVRDSVSGFRAYPINLGNIILTKSKSKGFGIATEELILSYLNGFKIKEIELEYAKPRKEFTKTYKLVEVLEGILLHEEELRMNGKYDLCDKLISVKQKIERKEPEISFDIGRRKFIFKDVGEGYTIK